MYVSLPLYPNHDAYYSLDHLMTGEILQCQLTGVLYRDGEPASRRYPRNTDDTVGMIFFVYMLRTSNSRRIIGVPAQYEYRQ